MKTCKYLRIPRDRGEDGMLHNSLGGELLSSPQTSDRYQKEGRYPAVIKQTWYNSLWHTILNYPCWREVFGSGLSTWSEQVSKRATSFLQAVCFTTLPYAVQI